jgi:esterase/lipase superfamily enzyme
MILASCRKHFDSNQTFDDDLQYRLYPNLSDTTTFTELTEGELAAAVEDKHVVVLVHGFRSPLKNCAAAYRKVENELASRGLIGTAGNYDLAVGFLWPGFQTALGFFPAVPFANRSAAFFRTFMRILNSHAHTVDVETHSLGARVAMQAMAFEPEVFVDNLLMTAAAIDNEVLEPKEEFHQSLASCRRCLVYHSSKDPVLKVLYRLGSLDGALGENGPEHPKVVEQECPEVFVVDCSAMVKSHGGYREAPEVYDHWERVLSDEALPRFEVLKKQK